MWSTKPRSRGGKKEPPRWRKQTPFGSGKKKGAGFAKWIADALEQQKTKPIFQWIRDPLDIPTDIFINPRGVALNDPVDKADNTAVKWQAVWSDGEE